MDQAVIDILKDRRDYEVKQRDTYARLLAEHTEEFETDKAQFEGHVSASETLIAAIDGVLLLEKK